MFFLLWMNLASWRFEGKHSLLIWNINPENTENKLQRHWERALALIWGTSICEVRLRHFLQYREKIRNEMTK